VTATWPMPGIAYGGDYNPEQWPREVWAEDIRLMQEAGVSLVSLGIFSWALLEPEQGRFDLDWLAEVLDQLHAGGIRVDLATATASPPPWLSLRYPETLPVRADGTRLWPGGRQAWCPSSPVFRERALALVETMAKAFGPHPSVVMWHVSNELGCHNVHCYCDVSAEAFRRWLQLRYGDLDALNAAWGTAFWSQHYGDWSQIVPPRVAPSFPNPTSQLDFARFSSDELLDYYRAERDVLRSVTPDLPVTTNFMVSSHIRGMDYWAWAPEQDLVSQDHYLDARLPDPHIELSFTADLTRGLAGGGPWWLMEHSTSAVNWQPVNLAKAPGQLARNSLQHVARGADAVCFFQWRASRAGAEKFHSGLVPHAGTDTKVWREVVELGHTLTSLAEVAGSRTRAEVAMVFDWQAWWGCELDSHPSEGVRYLDAPLALYRALWTDGVAVDFVPPGGDLTGYRLVVVPTLYLTADATTPWLHDFVAGGGHALVTYFSGIVDETDAIRLGGYPGAFRELLGVRTEEFFPLLPGDSVALAGELLDGERADLWSELLRLDGATAVATFADGPLRGVPAVTRREVGEGAAWYVATRLSATGTATLLRAVRDGAGVRPVAEVPAGVEVVRRSAVTDPDRSWLFVLNHTGEEAQVAVTGTDLVSGAECRGSLLLAPGAVAVVREERP